MKNRLSVLIATSVMAFPMMSHAFSSSDSIRNVAVALDMVKQELETGVASTQAAPAKQDDISIESLVAAGARVKSYKVTNDLLGMCMVTFKLSTNSLKSYRIEKKNDSYFGPSCP